MLPHKLHAMTWASARISPRHPAWLSPLSRLCAAIIGGYVLAQLCIGLFSLLPMPPVEAVLTTVLTAALVHVLALFWVFSTRTTASAWLGLCLPSAALGLALWLALPATAS